MVGSHIMSKERLPSVQHSLLTDKLNIDHIQSINAGNPELPPPIDPQCIEDSLSALP